MPNKKNLKYIAVGLIILAVLLILGFIIFLSLKQIASRDTTPKNDTAEIIDTKSGTKITFSKDGTVNYNNGSDTTSFVWDTSKTSSFFDYLVQNLSDTTDGQYNITLTINGTTHYGSLPGSDELLNNVITDAGNSGGQSSGGTGGSGTAGNIFIKSPTPAPYVTPPPDAPSWCLHWRLSYCADYLYPPTTSTPSPTPNSGTVVTAVSCSDWNKKSGENTTIGDLKCITDTPSPNPNPYSY